jgi:YidC/Oxa1 family membrane protein insertase
MPILVGLWQALNNSVPLRNAPFLYIKNLAAPDMLFRFPTELPLLGDYFNLLPFLVVSLMLVQTKLFSPPATTPEAEMQQKMMKYMMIFMAFMFYKVPSGLGIYFIMSSLWSIGERLILPKITKSSPIVEGGDEKKSPAAAGGKGGTAANGASDKPGGWLSQRLEKLLDEAAQDGTYRKDAKDPNKDRDKGKPRARPGRRR